MDKKRVDLFSAWKNLNGVVVTVDSNEHVLQLLLNLKNNEQLCYLDLEQDSLQDALLNLVCELLLRKQFFQLRFNKFVTQVKNRIKEVWIQDKQRFTGKSIRWDQKVKLHNASFKCLGRVDELNLRYQADNLVLDYVNLEAIASTTLNEFIHGITRTVMRFA
ncbi:hypothetical protein L596_017456 [Steinernema carpocapsae]|uniref:Uncharacterized protein n=1 Tax=Steinernema carpocapsae TaxID=34508 RepID=A0A4U5N1Q4_STECR|nr:hypothetical protein L596_017456 [Steinernema carpocapsae]